MTMDVALGAMIKNYEVMIMMDLRFSNIVKLGALCWLILARGFIKLSGEIWESMKKRKKFLVFRR